MERQDENPCTRKQNQSTTQKDVKLPSMRLPLLPLTADDIDCYDILRFEEFQLDFEPVDDEAFVHRDAFADVDENGTWMRIRVTSLSD